MTRTTRRSCAQAPASTRTNLWVDRRPKHPFLFSVFPELAYDSWVTIGIDQAPVPGDGNGAISLVQADGDSWVEDFEAGGNLEINSFFGGSWFTTILDDNGVAGADKKVLLAQLTTDGTLTGQLPCRSSRRQRRQRRVPHAQFWRQQPCGCTDEAACNYSESALYDDGSCDYLSCTGCTDAAPATTRKAPRWKMARASTLRPTSTATATA